MLMPCVLLMGKPVPAQLTVDPDTVQPEICWLAALMGTPLATQVGNRIRDAVGAVARQPKYSSELLGWAEHAIEGVVTL